MQDTPPKPEEGSARNVNAWHWEERGQTHWVKQRLNELFIGLQVPDFENGFVKITALPEVNGDAFINIRKGRKMVGYDMQLKFKWEGELSIDDKVEKATGRIEIPNFCNDDDEYTVRFSVQGNKSHHNTLKEKIVQFKPTILAKLSQLITELATR